MYTTPITYADRRRGRSLGAATNPWVNTAIVGGNLAAKGAGGGTGEQLIMMSVAGTGAIIGGFAAAAASSAAAASAASVAAGGASIAASGWATAAIPIVGPIIAGVTIALSLYFARKGPKQKKATTEIVNKVEPELKKNLEAYLALPAHYASAQQQALNNFDAGWAFVQDQCNIPEMGNPGIACTADRQRGGRWDWFSYYRDPIANDPNVVPDPSSLDQAVNGAGLGGSVNIGGTSVPVVLLMGGGLLALLMLSGGGGGGRQ